jgi:P27 family predicted phage terminase small subunit
MGARGPAPKPTALKELEGNPGKRSLNRSEPRPDVEAPACPKWVTGEGRKEWRRIVPLLVRLGLLTKVDRAALVGYCQAWARVVQAEEEMQKPGFQMIEVTDKGYAHVNPWFQVWTQSMKQVKAFGAEFGLTPAARSRVQTPEASEDDKFEEFVRRRNGGSSG